MNTRRTTIDVARAIATILVAATLALVSGCGSIIPFNPPGGTVSKDDLIAALEPGTYLHALASDPNTTADLRPSPGLDGWRIFDLQNYRGHPARAFVALGPARQVLPLTDNRDNFVTMSKASPPSAADAAARASDFLELTRSMRSLSYPISSVADIQWIPTPSPVAAGEQKRVTDAYAARIKPPTAVATTTGWTVTLWRIEENTHLVRHKVDVGRDGGLVDRAEVLEKALPLPIGI